MWDLFVALGAFQSVQPEFQAEEGGTVVALAAHDILYCVKESGVIAARENETAFKEKKRQVSRCF